MCPKASQAENSDKIIFDYFSSLQAVKMAGLPFSAIRAHGSYDIIY